MKNQFLKIVILFLLICFGCNKSSKNKLNSDYSYLPQDVIQTDTLTQTIFNSWFKTKIVTENGMVVPANSLTSKFDKNFDFYKWSEQMFLWMTSHENGKTVIESPEFYTVSPIVGGKRALIPHQDGKLIKASSSIFKKGANGLRVIKDKNGTPFEVEIHASTEKVLAKNDKNVLMAVHHIETDAAGQTVLKDSNKQLLNSQKLVFQSKFKSSKVIHQFMINKKLVFLNSNGNIVDVELGQAGGDGVLMTQNQSLVYYITMCNDVFAYYLSGFKSTDPSNQIADSQFPTTQAQLQAVLNYAKRKGLPPPKNPNALAMEIKTSWVEVTPDLKNSESYIQIKAIVPVYDKTISKQWTPKGERTATLAMVGMHVVGSVAGHPEMIWATFEHKKNTPNLGYAYRDKNNNIKQVPADNGKDWLFNNDASKTDSINNPTMRVKQIINNKKDTVNVIAFDLAKIVSPRVKRIMAWGSAANTKPNPENATPADANSQVININNAIQNMLIGNDVRKNYLMIGATWTTGAAPNGSSYPYNTPSDSIPKIPKKFPVGNALGTAQVSNSTMETYTQSGSTYETQMSCFACHSNQKNQPSLNANQLSHVFVRLQPLPSGFALKKNN